MDTLWLSWKRICLQCRRPWFDSWVGKIPWRRDRLPTLIFLVFPGDSDGEESTCNAGDSGLIPGSGRSPGEGIGSSLQYSWASLVAQMVKNCQQCGRPGLVGKIPWRRAWQPSPIFLPGECPWTEELGGL